MPSSHFILMIESDPVRTETLATQLVRLGVEPIRVEDLAEGVATVKAKEYAFQAVLVPSDLPPKEVAHAMKSMRRREPVLPGMAYGKPPVSGQARGLRRAGVLLALWDGYDEGILRFQVNRLVSGENQGPARTAPRVPTHEDVRILIGGREKTGLLYSLSETGCFIESPRASMDGAQLRMLFELDGQAVEVDGSVVFANVPGNLQRPNLPLGMGIRFDEIESKTQKVMARFITERLKSLEV